MLYRKQKKGHHYQHNLFCLFVQFFCLHAPNQITKVTVYVFNHNIGVVDLSHRIFPYFYKIWKILNKVLYKNKNPPNFGPISFLAETKSICQRYDTTSQVMFEQQEGNAVEYIPLLGTNGLDQTKVQWTMLSAP